MFIRIIAIFAVLVGGLGESFVYADQKASNILTTEGGNLSIAQETMQNLSVSDSMKDVIISGADVIDVIVLDSRNLRLIPQKRGFSDLIVVGDHGAVIGQVKIQVLPPKNSTLTIHRNGVLSTYN